MTEKNKRIFLIGVLCFLILFSCRSFAEEIGGNIMTEDDEKMLESILKQAHALLGQKPNAVVIVNGKKFKLDCIGTVSAVFWSVNLDIRKYFNKYKGNGVARLFYTLEDYKSIHGNQMPEVGDVIFWDNTWDRNGDGKFGNDPLTHAGIVVQVDDDGTIHYIHENYVYGVVVEYMNLYHPNVSKDENGKILNSPMHINSGSKNKPPRWLSGDLFKKFGGIMKVKKVFAEE